ncbi:MAG: hypothetical protein JJ992_10425, partial [Planctomycetes bacterium]|nr:hypothetical protein [Planctomycetota bacterium]
NHKQKGLLDESAIVVKAGDGNEDRLIDGSYRALRDAEQRDRQLEQQKRLDEAGIENSYLPDFLQ